MHILPIIGGLILLSFLLYMLQTVPLKMPPWFRWVLTLVIGLMLICWVLNLLGIHTGLPIQL